MTDLVVYDEDFFVVADEPNGRPTTYRRVPASNVSVASFALLAVPVAPTSVVAHSHNGQARVRWTPSVSGVVTSYTVTASPGGATATVDWPAREATVTGLTNGTAYTFTATATNTAGTSAASLASNSVTPSSPPGGVAVQGCCTWLTAASLALSNGASVVTWTDSSGNGITATPPSSPYTGVAPTMLTSWTNSRPALTFNGTSMDLITNLTQEFIGSQMTLFIVLDMTSASGDRRVLCDQSASTDSYSNNLDTNGPAWRAIFGGMVTPANLPSATNTPTVLSFTMPGYGYVSGTKFTTTTLTTPAVRSNVYWIGALADSKLFPGRIAEIIIYDRILSDTERQAVEAYLGTRYNITMAVS